MTDTGLTDSDSDITLPPSPSLPAPDSVLPIEARKDSPRAVYSPLLFSDTPSDSEPEILGESDSDTYLTGETPAGAYACDQPSSSSSLSLYFGTPSPKKPPAVRPKRANITDLQIENVNLKKRVKELEEENAGLKKQLKWEKSMKSEMDELKKDCKRLKKAIEKEHNPK